MRVSAQRESRPEPAPPSSLARPALHPSSTHAGEFGEPGDEHEQEADRASELVMRMAGQPPSGACACGGACLTCLTTPPAEGVEAADPRRPEGPSLVHEVLRSPGRPLDPATRAFMEPRFGHDFSRVRVHTDGRAAESSRSIEARAYTAGADIVFGAGQYSPHTETGRHLLAHELTHVLQQRRGDAGLRRKELAGTNVSHRGSVEPGDWLDRDREEWEMLSLRGQERALSPTNTFMRAVYYNTQKIRPEEYRTIRERHDYYDLISYVLEYDRNTPAALRGVRFFHATTSVTGHPGLGSVDRTIGAIKLSDTTRQIFREINAELFALNMKIIHNLIFEWQEPKKPTGPSGAIGSFEFDLRMVETEQTAVEDYIRRNKQLFTPGVSKEINDTLDPDAFGQFFNFASTSFEWARDALKVKALDFTNKEHRKAIGFASVHIFHRKSYSDYEFFVAAYHVVPQR
jgi:hypothetical protein